MSNLLWLLRMAWRDSRRSRARLLLFMASIVLGIAALVGINSFGDNLARSVREQARELLGADLVLSANKPFARSLKPVLSRLGEARTREVSFASMAEFRPGKGVRLVQVRARDGGFFYGEWLTEPRAAAQRFAAPGAAPGALVDDVLLSQFGAKVGDSVQVGRVTLPIIGRVLKTPGQTGIATAVAPTVFIPASLVRQTGLLQRGSRVQYHRSFRFAPGTDVAAAIKPLQARLDKADIDVDTVASRQQQVGRAFADLTRYLSLVAFVALLLGCVGVASAVNLYVREKLAAVAILRCLGASGRQALLIYLLQTSGLGLVGAVLGAALGAAVQTMLPRVLGDFLPVAITVSVSWPAVLTGLATGLLMAVLFALLPLLSIRRVSPLRVLRVAFEDDTTAPDPLRGVVLLIIGLFILAFAYQQTRDWKLTLGFGAGLLVAFVALAGIGRLLMALVRRFFPVGWGYVWRQGLANLHRPQNQTLTLITSIGLGTFLLATLFLTQALLLGRVQIAGRGSQPNLVLFDIQREQRAGVENLLRAQRLPVLQRVPIVTMRLLAINGRSSSALKKDTAGIPPWVLSREYRVTYRDSLNSSEKLTSGQAPTLGTDGIPLISIETAYLKRAKLKLGDTLDFNVQGSPLRAIVGGSREIDRSRVQPSFLVLFPAGVLEEAPQFQVLLTRTPNTAALAAVQQGLVRDFPNVSAIDLGLILQTVEDILDKISFVVRFMAGFSILTGLLVLSSSVVISRYQRVRESVLLRTLGASRRQILRITLVEYGLLGLLASLAGIGLAVLAAWALAVYVFEVGFGPALLPLLGLAGLVTALTACIGLFNSRDVLRRSPLEVLRAEG
ncbi:FtsX-like permease family protein [Hymenobacter sp. BT770]|uniref:ABC transporter permease n=1 Tax=Hymenobacter sp. BT770 TaxID=2886942 RepID=UPI001D0F552E|nr:FtsX-like permease family protein [Hymenobacter sp. BT770]MCC3152318.1 FtsX-like permease family protein [Hymenobacter sp. BT770]MDO3414131.1 FtsX-like permease family protein [Hymenobacter sp. BT770]